MFLKKFFTIGTFVLVSFGLQADYNMNKSKSAFDKLSSNVKYYDVLAAELYNSGLPFTSVAFAKEYLANLGGKKRKKSFDVTLNAIIDRVGIKQFETLPINILRSSFSPIVKYIKAKKYFRRGSYAEALNEIKGLGGRDELGPYINMLRGSIHAIQGNNQQAISEYEKCLANSSTQIGKNSSKIRNKNLMVNRDYCLVGLARVNFAMKNYSKAESIYLDLDKASPIWPEILFEEAWNSFYLKNYNRTLGKLVTYNAPIFRHFFMPEREVLEALSYLELCLYDDTKKVVDSFYEKYFKDAEELRQFINRTGKDYDFYAKVAISRIKNQVRGTELFNDILKSIINEPSFQLLFDNYLQGAKELRALKGVGNSRFKQVAIVNLSDTLRLQLRLIGSYVRKNLILKYSMLSKTFEGMSFIKLEVLSRIKTTLYTPNENSDGKRGDLKYLDRNDKQYFWGFNGEFWADELGDYVFALKSECRQ